MTDLEAALARWKAAGPLSPESTKLLVDLREANLLGQPQELIFAVFVRSLTQEQKEAMAKRASASGRKRRSRGG